MARWKPQDGTRRFEIEAMRPAKDHFVARIAGIDDRDAAEKLRNLELYVPRARLPKIDEDDTFYHADLVGLDAVTPDGAQIGTVHALHNFGAGDIIEIAPVGGGEPLMLPFNDTTVPKIDLAAKHGRVPAEIEGGTIDMWRADQSAHSRASGNPERQFCRKSAPGPLSRG